MATLSFSAGTSADAINTALERVIKATLPSEEIVVKLGKGVFNLDKPIYINRSNVSLLGAGVDQTVLTVAAKAKGNAQAIVVDGKEATFVGTLTASTTALAKGADPLKAGTHVLKLGNASGITAGSVIRIDQENDQKYLNASGNGFLKAGELNAEGRYLRRMIAEVTKVNGDEVTIKTATPYAFDAGKAKVSLVSGRSVTDLDIGGFTVKSDLGTPDKYKFENALTDKRLTTGASKAAIDIDNAYKISMHDIKTVNTVSNAFDFSSIYGSTFNKLTAQGAWNKDGGNGYAFLIKTAFSNTFDNLVDRDMRHSFITGSYTPEHYNDVHIIFTNRDVNFHGSPDSFNKIEVDKAELDFRIVEYSHPAVATGNFKQHPNADFGVNDTIDWNDITFKYMLGSNSKDVVHADPGGAVLIGNGDEDQLFGGAGKDLLWGGDDLDILVGGGSRDTFVFGRGSAEDEVRDFKQGTAVDSDVLDLKGTGITSREGMSVHYVKGDTLISLGDGDVLTLKGITEAEFRSVALKFDTTNLRSGVKLTGIGSDLGFVGTKLADSFTLKTGYLADRPDILGMGGRDTLAFNVGTIFDSSDLGRTVGIDILDMSAATKEARITLDAAFIAQSDADSVTVKVGKHGAEIKTSGIRDWNSVRVEGPGQVVLSKDGVALSAASGAINVIGGSGLDRIKGGSVADLLDGGKGEDVLEGGKGDDTFFFTTKLGDSNVDKVTDFSNERGDNDAFKLGKDIFEGLSGKVLAEDAFAVVTKGPVTGTDGDARIIYDKANGDLYFDGEGSNRIQKFAHLDGNPALANTDFLLV